MDFGVFFDYPGGDAATTGDRLLFLAGCSERDWALIGEHAQVRRFAAGTLVVGPGDSDRALHLVTDGTLEVLARPGTRHAPPSQLGPGAVFGELGFLDGRPADAAVRAATDAQVLRLGLAEFEVLAAKDPALGRYLLFDLARLLAERVQDLHGLLRQQGR
jgi:CRP-like cAMP-binding protein